MTVLPRAATDEVLLAEVREACAQVRLLGDVSGGLATLSVPALERTTQGLKATHRDVVEWTAVLAAVARTPGFWARMVSVVNALDDDADVDAALGWERAPDARAVPLWDTIIGPIVARYGRRRADLNWDEALGRALIGEWRATRGGGPVRHRTIAPLHNLRGMPDPVVLDEHTAIRAMTDDDRDGLWRGFGASGDSSIAPTVGQLESWTDVIDLRWPMSRTPPLSSQAATDRISDVVTALRLHHAGVTGTTVLWTRLDPPDAPEALTFGMHHLFVPLGAGVYMHPLAAEVGPGDAPALRRLLVALQTTRGDRRFAIARRRFDSAYARHELEDALIDYWVAFEALLVPDGTAELRYRAALRIGRIAGASAAERQDAFRIARGSYDFRSKVVHGDIPPNDLNDVVENTRQLARVVLARWVLDPPRGGIDGIDRELLA